jgi:hypothetical protein
VRIHAKEEIIDSMKERTLTIEENEEKRDKVYISE